MTNARIADAFDKMADILEFQGANQFRVRAYRNSARTIRDYPDPLAEMATNSPQDLRKIEGIGEDLAKKIVVMSTTGVLPQLVELEAQVPQSVLALLNIPGVGPKKAAALHKELGIVSLDHLKAACEDQKVRALKGFGEKTEQIILAGLAIAGESQKRMLWAQADAVVSDLREHLKGAAGVKQLEFAGSYRRGKDTVGDLDILVTAADPNPVMDALGSFQGILSVIVRGETKMSVRIAGNFQVDLRVVPEESFGAALQYFTGSKEHNVVLRGRAKDRGLKINEWGIFRVTEKGEERIGGATEEEIYREMSLPVFPPELRENRREFAWAAAGGLPKLITLEDIQGDLHMHTEATDGKGTIRDMIAAAKARGRSYIAITDHSKRVSMARGLDGDRLRAQWKEIDEIRKELDKSFTLLKGVECDILEAGGMDLPDDVLAEADWVLASVHYGQKQSRQQITERILGAIENPHVDCIAHPTGRLLNKRDPYDVDIDAVIAAAKKHGKLLEINASPERLDLNDAYAAAAKQQGIPLVIDTDAHSPDGMGVMRYGVLQARRAGLTAADVANTRSWPEMKKLMGGQR